MKIKSILSFCVPAAMMSLALAGCSDYDNGYTEGTIKFNQNFRAAFGDIDPEQDWNLAERGNVTVSTSRESEVKIYVLKGNEYCLVGDYEGVRGTQTLGFDMLEGTNSIVVSDGVTAVTTVPGGSANFSESRTTFVGQSGKVTVSKLTATVTIDGKEYPQYHNWTSADYEELKSIVPEGSANLNKVTHDFTYVSNGSFIIYPLYWNSSSINTIGVYYYDENGQMQTYDVYRIKESNAGADSELMIANNYVIDGNPRVFSQDGGGSIAYGNPRKWPQSWTFNGREENDADKKQFHYNGWSTEQSFSTPFIEYWYQSTNLPDADLNRTITDLEPNTRYRVETKVRLMNENVSATDYPSGASFYVGDNVVGINRATLNTGLDNNKKYVSGDLVLEGTTDVNGHLSVGFNVQNCNANWLAFKNITVTKLKPQWSTTDGSTLVEGTTRAQGIRVDIPKGTKFGMYLKKSDSSGSYTFYSESDKNDISKVGNGVTVDANGNKVQVSDMNPCYASTFYNEAGQMFLGFEDWPNKAQMSDFDLNDAVIAFKGLKPTIINEDPEPAGTWMLVCEDLGGSFDIDYNDVVFKVEHTSGREFAMVTPLAAGGTLASYIFFTDPTNINAQEQCLGEIHQMFGETPAASGEYSPINVYNNREDKIGRQRTITVGKNWTMAYFSFETMGQGVSYNTNMGGFEIRVLNPGTPAPTGEVNSANSAFGGASRIPAPDKGEAPFIMCLPYSYKVVNKPYQGVTGEYVWAWPVELQPICEIGDHRAGPYPRFTQWVLNHEVNRDWYMYRETNSTVNELLLKTEPNGSAPVVVKQPSNLAVASSANMSPTVEETINLRNYFTTSSTGGITYDVIDVTSNEGLYGLTDPNFKLLRTGNTKVVVHQAADDNYEAGELTFNLNVKAKPATSNSYNFNNEKKTEFSIEVVKQSNGKYDVKYNGTTVMQGVSTLTFKWSENNEGQFWVHSTNWAINGKQYTQSVSGTEVVNLSPIGNSGTLIANVNNWGTGFKLTIEGS